VMKRL